MQDIASEFSINWDSNAFKLRMSRSSAVEQVLSFAFPFHVILISFSKLNTYIILTLFQIFRMYVKFLIFLCTGTQCLYV